MAGVIGQSSARTTSAASGLSMAAGSRWVCIVNTGSCLGPAKEEVGRGVKDGGGLEGGGRGGIIDK